MSIDTGSEPLSVPTENADDLTATNTPDLMANEQTWPTEEEMGEASNSVSAAAGGGDIKRTKRVPKGTSAYQAAWIVDEDEYDDGDEDEDEDEDEMDVEGDEGEQAVADGFGREGGDEEDEEETEEIELDSRRGETHRDLDPEQEERE
jgi:pre-rRNA-processing protein TSR1